MTDDAADWSAHDLDRRFNRGEPYDELTQLAATLDALLERLSASLRHEQRFTAELSHELRTPLARIAGESELALRRERAAEDYRASLEAVQRNAEQMTRTVEALVAAARQEAGLEQVDERCARRRPGSRRSGARPGRDRRDRDGAPPARSSGARGDRARAPRADRAAVARQRASLRPLARIRRAGASTAPLRSSRSATMVPAWRRKRRSGSSSRASEARRRLTSRGARASVSLSPAGSPVRPAGRSWPRRTAMARGSGSPAAGLTDAV